MASLQLFDAFMLAVARKKHDLGADQLVVALCNQAHQPDIHAAAVLADLTQIAYTNLSSRVVTVTSFTQTSGIAKLVLADLALLASGGSVAGFRYVVLYNNTAAAKDLIAMADYGSDFVLVDTKTFTVDFDGAAGAITFGACA